LRDGYWRRHLGTLDVWLLLEGGLAARGSLACQRTHLSFRSTDQVSARLPDCPTHISSTSPSQPQVQRCTAEQSRQFFRLKVKRDIRAVLQSKPDNGLQRRKFKRVAKVLNLRHPKILSDIPWPQEIQKLEMANMGNANKRARRAFEHVLDLAYGRKGPLRWDIMKVRVYHIPSDRLLTQIYAAAADSSWRCPSSENHSRRGEIAPTCLFFGAS
jgi:hypothetical protein